MIVEEPVQQGMLLFPPQGMLGQLKKSWHKKFCQLFRASNYGIDRLEIYDNQDEALTQLTQRIITLEACVKIAPINQPNVFTVVTKSGIHHFGCFSETEMTSWMSAFQSVAFKDTASSQTIEEDNDLYCTSGEGIFSVKLVETEASKLCGLEPKNYTLIVAAAEIKLLNGETPLFTWPYRFIRKYGYRDGTFTFEAGRKCESGAGSFRLEHKNQQEIFRCIESKMKYMKKLLSGETSPSIECNDAQFHAALSMEARSRSPLPPSPNSSSHLIDIDFSTSSQKLLNSSSSIESTQLFKPPPPIPKQKPMKPPRKAIFTTVLDKKHLELEFPETSTRGKYRRLHPIGNHDHDSSSNSSSQNDKHSYDLVEVRNDAWRTHGIDRVPHMERLNASSSDSNKDDDSPYETVTPLPLSSQGSVRSKLNSNDATTANSPISPIIHNTFPIKSDDSDYDKLQYFGTIHKSDPNPAYRTPNITIPRSLPLVQTISDANDHSQNNYDLVENYTQMVNEMSAVRLADDSHLGYGVIRKKTANNTDPEYKLYNDTEYAIVSKPKRV
ncbi:uncharacterized protein LOC122500497 [Leptopilina heterotoma]|uniref:uncharacterized protein LOC122500497 n=1 Tax=Leptopilina heterotoma TaxID=63436 RepID=UPI001CA8B837|nr:uncharacterized protein LOC122500497 [Leptopilina heterotoma]